MSPRTQWRLTCWTWGAWCVGLGTAAGLGMCAGWLAATCITTEAAWLASAEAFAVTAWCTTAAKRTLLTAATERTWLVTTWSAAAEAATRVATVTAAETAAFATIATAKAATFATITAAERTLLTAAIATERTLTVAAEAATVTAAETTAFTTITATAERALLAATIATEGTLAAAITAAETAEAWLLAEAGRITLTAAETGGTTTATAAAEALAASTAAATIATTTTTEFGLWSALLWFHAWNDFRVEALTCVGFDVENTATIAELRKRHSQTLATSTTGTTDTVRIVFGLHGQTKVEHVRDCGHVNAACSYVGSHQNLHLTVAQRRQSAVTQALAQSTVQSNGGETILLQVGGQAIAFNLRAGENHCLVDRCVAQPVIQQLALVLSVVGPEQHLLDVGVSFLRRVDLDLLHGRAVIVHHAHGELLNARRESSAEHHGLTTLAGHLVDLGEIVREAQIQHTVGFVNHQELDLVELDLHGALQVEQTARSCHYQISILQLGDLELVRHTAHHVRNAQTLAMTHQVDGVVCNLLSQFAGWAQNQGAWNSSLEIAWVGRVLATVALGSWFAIGGSFSALTIVVSTFFSKLFVLLLEQRVQHGQQEGSGLAATCLAGNHQVDEAIGIASSFHGVRNGLFLYGCRLGVTQIGNGLDQLGCKTQFGKSVRTGVDHCFNSSSIICCSVNGQFVFYGRRRGIKFSCEDFFRQSGMSRREIALRMQRVSHVLCNRRRNLRRLHFKWLKTHQPFNKACASEEMLGGWVFISGEFVDCPRLNWTAIPYAVNPE